MNISYAASAIGGFKKWFAAHPSSNYKNDQPGGAIPIAPATPDASVPMPAQGEKVRG
jgi:hypothetical protein